MKRFLWIFGICFFSSQALFFGADGSGTCRVMKGMPVKSQYSVDYQGKKIEFCCAACVKVFKRNPSKYL